MTVDLYDPTRVSWMLPNGLGTSRVFATRERALEHVRNAGLDPSACVVQPASERPPYLGRRRPHGRWMNAAH